MTYKKIVEGMVEAEARKWVKEVLEENGYDTPFIYFDGVELDNDKKADTVYWTVKARINFNRIIPTRIEIGGTVDDFFGVCCSVIWNTTYADKEIIWMNVEATRTSLGITSLKLA